MLMEWIEGEDMEEVLSSLSFIKQYELGCEARKIMKYIHGLDIKFEHFDWCEKFSKKIDKKIEMNNNCVLKYDSGHLFFEYINKSKELLKNRTLTMGHKCESSFCRRKSEWIF